jgi:hypothetical protein
VDARAGRPPDCQHVYCIIKTKDDFANARPGFGLFGIFAVIGAGAILAWLLFLFALAHSGV